MGEVIATVSVPAHYSIKTIEGMEALRAAFPSGEANELNFVLFSTSGVHGTYTTIEEIESGLEKYGDDYSGDAEDWPGDSLTILVVHPRIVCLRYGNVTVRKADLPYLKKLRASSLAAIASL